MALQQLPVTEATIQVVHSGEFTGEAFSTTLDASDGAPVAPQQVFTFDLNVFAPDLVASNLTPLVAVLREPTGEQVEVDTKIEAELITLTFWESVTPSDYRIKVIG